VLAHQLEDQLKQKYRAKLATERQKYDGQVVQLNKAKEAYISQFRQGGKDAIKNTFTLRSDAMGIAR
jgi:hypothetical protein